MEREKLVKSVMSGDSRLRTPEPVSTPVNTNVNKLKAVERERRTPTMTIFKGSNTPVRARPVSLFVHSENVNNKGTASGLNRSSSLRKVSGEYSPVVPSPTPPSPEIQFQGNRHQSYFYLNWTFISFACHQRVTWLLGCVNFFTFLLSACLFVSFKCKNGIFLTAEKVHEFFNSSRKSETIQHIVSFTIYKKWWLKKQHLMHEIVSRKRGKKRQELYI